jgi:plasmid stabilization system protein ParE
VEIIWTTSCLGDLDRLFDFLAAANELAAIRTVQALVAAPGRLIENPRLGERLDEFLPREVRRLLIGHYEMRYEVKDMTVFVLRIWHTREDR